MAVKKEKVEVKVEVEPKIKAEPKVKKTVGRKPKDETLKATSTIDIEKEFKSNDDFDANSPFTTERVETQDYGVEKMDTRGMPKEIPTHNITPVSLSMNDLDAIKTPQTVIHEEEEKEEEPIHKPTNERISNNYERQDETNDGYVEPELPPREMNPIISTDNLDEKEKKRGAEQLVDMAFHMYRQLLLLGVNKLSIDDKALKKLEEKKKIDLRILNVQLPISRPDENGNVRTQSVLTFIQNYNEGLGEVLKPDEEVLEEIRPLLVEKFQEQGWGISDNTKVLFLFVEMTAKQVMGVFSLKSSVNSVFELATESFAVQRDKIANDEANRKMEEAKIKSEKEANKRKPKVEGDVTILTNTKEKKEEKVKTPITTVEEIKGGIEPEEVGQK